MFNSRSLTRCWIAGALLCASLQVISGSAQRPSPRAAASTTEADELFDGSELHDIWIHINARDWEQLRTAYRENPGVFIGEVSARYAKRGVLDGQVDLGRAFGLDRGLNQTLVRHRQTLGEGASLTADLEFADPEYRLLRGLGAGIGNRVDRQLRSTAGLSKSWRNAGINFRFGANGQMNPAITSTTFNNMTVNGINLGNLEVAFGAGGITQFADPNGNVQVNLLQQNGYAAGELQQVSVNDKGRVVGSYSNGRSIDLAEITLANFNGTNGLQRIDGGAFESTDASGPATYNAPGKIVSSSLEGSNTDIADEFTKLIVTQQAYSANTKVITTSNTMVQDLLNVLR